MRPRIWQNELGDLADKYAALVELRREREALEAQGIYSLDGDAGRQRKRRGQALARRFPGALREIEGLSAVQMQRRLDVVQSLLASGASRDAAPLWLCLVADYHAALREVLAVKRWLGRSKGSGADARALLPPFKSWFSSCPHRRMPLEQVSAAWLETLRRPPQGRVVCLVWQELEQCYGLAEATIRELIFFYTPAPNEVEICRG